ncbi:4-(cytidine 5'-diphospho)-2-C-methyl-D-erythritol kinase [Bacteroides sp.]|uniref:4-(cytidine 5'-diphospho)-2-C-methyl-D-erythritol kinase n=1 Tax=Bacteroides sp. TaxID=29523 RepID=UPI001B5C1CF3|nr:4-(cytidine 5'-diphospho)-2-C-methyl-D-erythritol kinase [Bacteroides sp.]MBP6065707.1 4-(cytidine 5'-diphospho)-2-C-methyl-D-erythritol kinase [Bacteroides sp.]MBP6067976.1 4-(cytidine 5'-diphospho)-2-C-methyl-D-erythritol kinase [Bacteroides sp.]MBP6936771.1 4-(cytidine 5'-diphospho)-2-C-methyl-D-erythritol kinase [Bacteroides sp.]MBP8622450.1 4-(cytidine 5'-diphospho)-2-C-methyl-D-erythritol kinase [Bacteroides sp.]MBP9506633.1 4-(cytidine 5'-diphospho)-2-C-methyl-D-erythritol kinase [Ba
MITFPNAKINLGLHITEKRPDGYHNLETVFYPIPLEDALEIHLSPPGSNKPYSLHCSGIAVEGPAENNLVVKAYLLLKELFQLPPIDIHLFKHIPSGAGLGGGSADAAFMLHLLNERFTLNLSLDRLETYAATLGADCAFFIRNAPTFATGIGNLFSPISLSLAGYQLLVIKPDVFVSTREAFSKINPHRPRYALQEVIQQPLSEWRGLLVNDFEASVFPQFPVIGEIKEELYRQGAIYASMSGSGSAVFGLFARDAELPKVELHACYRLVL